MDGLTSFLQTLRLDIGWGYQRPSRQAQHDPETLSASVDLEDIISEYDEPSRKSRLTTGGQPSQSYFSLSGGPIDDETTSFYSALHDGFSLDDFELQNKYGQEFLWSDKNLNSERDVMLQPSDFQITWFDLNYAVRPRHTFGDLVNDCQTKLFRSISSASNIFNYCKTNASYEVNSKKLAKGGGHVSILHNVNGSFKSGELTAIMGPSGAGKTSLLNILSRRREEGFTGQIHVNETNNRLKINAIPQHDNLPECFTVRENLIFASRLKSSSPGQNHQKNVCRVSNLLGLDECLDARTKNISGGQQKRLAIAQELLSRPDILILDEPTSGLDSLTCLKTLSVLKDLVKASRKKMIDPIAIILTIHQPQLEAFNLFDKVYLMANGGIVIYDGSPANCTEFVEKYSGLKMPSDDYNPASFLIEIASGEFGQEPIDALSNQVRIEYAKLQDGPVYSRKNQKSITGRPSTRVEHSVSMKRDSIISFERSTGQSYKPDLYLDSRLAKSSSVDSGDFFAKTRILTERCWKSMWRDKKQMAGRIIFHLLLPFAIAFLVGTEPGQSNACPKYHSEYSLMGIMKSDEYISDEVQEDLLLSIENTGVLFMLIYSCISANIAAMTLTFALDMKTCLKEYYNGWYGMRSYIFARMLSFIPIDLTLPTSTIAIAYIVTGQNTGTSSDMPDIYRIGITSLAVVLGSMAGQIMGMIFGAIYIGHITTALFASQGATLPFVLLSGFVARTKNMSKFVRALGMTSMYKHCLEVTYIARYGWNVCGCERRLQFKEPRLTGVSDKLRNFVSFYMDSQDKNAKENSTGAAIVNSTEHGTRKESDIFDMIAKQLSLYNTYGIEVNSCDQVMPYELYDFNLTESDLPASFVALFLLDLSLLLILLLVVKLVVSYRTSL